ncbi:hypothetical protein FRZ67_08135 [Panacibacter ginsenosidivorans]|uniref:Outer membrane beta-barrel protein n=1 Tax=Panacibacter ginsenosidivorans TaxID=1813871 RepID=A0A5B8V7W8_9BACT|nr:hypothetical protein [Panacibacter ginsenosidivorans]QEC67265.1 hypothetical protein FRZ67_08135 [Panacibacter ginsenosidivorans]
MKKIYLPFMFSIFAFLSNAQYKKIELRSSVGYISDAQIYTTLDKSTYSFFGSLFSKDQKNFRLTDYGTYSQDLLFSLSDPHFQLTYSYVFERLKITDYSGINITTYKRNMNTALTGLHYNYVMKPKFSVYSGAEFGLRFNSYTGQTDKTPITQFAYQIVGGGIRYGKAFAGFTELGFGAKGWIHTGISVSF